MGQQLWNRLCCSLLLNILLLMGFILRVKTPFLFVMISAAFGSADIASLGIPSVDEYLAKYSQLSGLPTSSIWDFYVSFVYFRICAILQGVYKRFTLGKLISGKEMMCVFTCVF